MPHKGEDKEVFHVARDHEILEGRTTDVYFERTVEILEKRGINPRVRAEFVAKSLPGNWPRAIFAGGEEALRLLEPLPVRVRMLREGTTFRAGEPVLEIEGRYLDFGRFETATLGLICQASGIATQAARFKKLAGDRLVVSFGARRMHPAITPMIERSAYAGGCDGVSVLKSADLIGIEPTGTMPHALILCVGNTVEAARAYDEVLEPAIKRIALIDTFNDEKFEAINIAEALGDRYFAIRLDTPSSRRGDFLEILKECRWELDLRGYRDLKLIVSGGIKEEDLPVLNPLVSGYGIGTAIAGARTMDYSMDIVEIEGKPMAKRGKPSGSKSLLRCPSCRMRRLAPRIETTQPPACPQCGGKMADLLDTVLEEGRVLLDFEKETPSAIRERTLREIGDWTEPAAPPA